LFAVLLWVLCCLDCIFSLFAAHYRLSTQAGVAGWGPHHLWDVRPWNLTTVCKRTRQHCALREQADCYVCLLSSCCTKRPGDLFDHEAHVSYETAPLREAELQAHGWVPGCLSTRADPYNHEPRVWVNQIFREQT